MEKQSKTVTGAFSNLMDGLEMAAISAGTKISESLNLAGVLSGLAEQVDKVNQVIQQGGGIGDVLKTLIPPELQPAIVAVTGAIVGAMIPGLVSMAAAGIAAVAPLAPFIAAGAALAVVIWALVDPIGAAKSIMDFFGVSAEKQGQVIEWLKDPIGHLTSAWDNLVERLRSGAQGIIDSIKNMVETVKQKFNDLKNSLPSISLPSFGFAAGGVVRGYASGGRVHGPGSGTSDSVPAMLSSTSSPSISMPKAAYSPSRKKPSLCMMKNWLPAEFGFMALAMEMTPRLWLRSFWKRFFLNSPLME